MKIDLSYRRCYGRWFGTPVLRAVRRYSMIVPGDRIAVALSGGTDSVALLYILSYLQRHSHLRFELSAIHVRIADYDTAVLADLCNTLKVRYLEETVCPPDIPQSAKLCSACSRVRRGAMARRLAAEGIRTVAFAHHATDAAETLLMNIALHRTLSAFPPKVIFADTSLTLIRPLIYLEKRDIEHVYRHTGLPRLEWQCPYASTNIRERFRAAFREMETRLTVRSLARSVTLALERCDPSWHPQQTPIRRRGECDRAVDKS